jgi:hypothetical protein
LREIIVNQNKIIDNMSRKIASNDKVLETINNRMDSFTSAIKNQLSFNKMIESQISQLAASVPVAKKGKIPGNLEELETTNLVDIFNEGEYFIAPPRPLRPVWGEEDMPEKERRSRKTRHPHPHRSSHFRQSHLRFESKCQHYA